MCRSFQYNNTSNKMYPPMWHSISKIPQNWNYLSHSWQRNWNLPIKFLCSRVCTLRKFSWLWQCVCSYQQAFLWGLRLGDNIRTNYTNKFTNFYSTISYLLPSVSSCCLLATPNEIMTSTHLVKCLSHPVTFLVTWSRNTWLSDLLSSTDRV